ncbi:MAG: class I SAM-dependent methyltransferase [Pseudomonadales bacterium]|nr:class I SAM-dependent methyltransferase [Pseudomonadales bacterium]
MKSLSDEKIVDSWIKNASAWIAEVQEGLIESRKLVTDHAIIEAVLSCSPQTVVDLGCGEGWLSHQLSSLGIDVIGTDVVPALIVQAKQSGTGDFRLISYEEVAAGKLKTQSDALVCNFSLLGKDSVEKLFAFAPRLLKAKGMLIVQTLHPLVACGNAPYQDGWREGSWQGFRHDFSDPAPWYFRTLQSWINLFEKSGFQLRELREPLHPKTGKPASLILIAQSRESQ